MKTYYFAIVLTQTESLEYYPVAVRAANPKEAESLLRGWKKNPAKTLPHSIQQQRGFRGIERPRFWGQQKIVIYPPRNAVAVLV